MNRQFEARLRVAIGGAPAVMRGPYLQDAEAVRAAGVASYEGMLALALDRGADLAPRIAACALLGIFRGPRAQDALLAALRDPDPEMVRRAAASLAVSATRRTVGPLVDALRHGETPETRVGAAYALGFTWGRDPVGPLLEALGDAGEDPLVRGQAAESLAFYFDRGAVAPLMQALGDPSPVVRFWSAYALGILGSMGMAGAEAAAPALEAMVGTDEEVVPGWWSVSREAEIALAWMRGEDADHLMPESWGR